MNPWSFQRFQQPRLCVDAIDHDAGSKLVCLRSGPQTYRLAFDDDEAAGHIADDLRTLCDSATPLWSTLRDSPSDSPWHALLTFLDARSLLGEGRDDAAAQLHAQDQRIRECVAGTKAAVLHGLSEERLSIVEDHAAQLRQRLRQPIVIGPSCEVGEDPFDGATWPNFFLALLTVQIEYFRRFSPLSLQAADLLLGVILGEQEGRDAVRDGHYLSDAAGLYDERDLATHLWLFGWALVASSGDEAARLPTPPLPPQEICSGLELIHRVELLARTALAGWGENPYVTAIERSDGAHMPLVAGLFVEQYHVTRRFVEMITPLLSKRLAPPLRAMMFRYYGEEYGHDEFESTTCKTLGIAKAALEKALPLPLHFAFVDVLTLLADVAPITSFAAVMATEGIFGEPAKISHRVMELVRDNPAFQSVATDHEGMNDTLNHNSISRNLFEKILAVSPAQQLATMRRILFLLEVNHRAWRDIADFYGRQDRLALLGPLGRPLDPLG